MEYMTIKEVTEKWNLSVGRVQTICNESMIKGVIKFGHTWIIPKEVEKPVDKRIETKNISSENDRRYNLNSRL